MLGYAWRTLWTRPILWIPAGACAVMTVLPGSLVSLYLSVPLAALLLTGSGSLAFDLMPGPFDRPALLVPVALAGSAMALAVWSRLYAAAVWASEERNDGGLRSCFAGSRGRWTSVFVLYLHAYAIIGALFAVLALVVLLAGGGSSALGLAFGAAAVGIGLRALIRIALTLAIRASVLDDDGGTAAWRRGLSLLKERRRDVIALWIALMAMGCSLWLGGRLLSPALQETAFDYPQGSSLGLYREAGQVLLAAPLEAFLLVFSIGAWTALYRGERARPQRVGVAPPGDRIDPVRGPVTDPALPRLLGALVVVTVIANGIPTAVERAFEARTTRAEAAIESREITAEEVVRPLPSAPRAPGPVTSYDVRAALDGRRLEWTTRIRYTNDTGEPLEDVGIHIYPAAYTRRLENIPLADDLLAADISGRFRARAQPGALRISRVAAGGKPARYERADTEMTVALARPLDASDTIRLDISLVADLPSWPERFGSWDGMTLLGNWIPVVARREKGEWRFDEFASVGDPFFAEVAHYEVALTTSENLSVVGSGTLTQIEQTSRQRTWSFEAPASRDAAFAVGPFIRGLETEAAGTIVRSWYPVDDRLDGAANLQDAASAIRSYSSRFGPLPFDEVEVLRTRGSLGGMEHPGLVFVSDPSRAVEDLPILPELLAHSGFHEAQRRYVLGHEVAHQWWYAAVGSDQVREPWLDEALAEVSTRLWLGGGEDDQTWEMTNLVTDAKPQRGALSAGIGDFATNAEYGEVVYLSGAEILLRLRNRIGAPLFDRILASWFEDRVLAIGTTHQFIETVRTVGGTGAAEFLERYL